MVHSARNNTPFREVLPLVTLAELRAARKMTQAELGRYLGLTQAAISAYETGARTPPLKTARRIAAFFCVPLDAIEFSGGSESNRRERAQEAAYGESTARKEAAS